MCWTESTERVAMHRYESVGPFAIPEAAAHVAVDERGQSVAPAKPYIAAFVSAGRAALRSSTVRVAHTSRNTR
jgi:hypothetical protein